MKTKSKKIITILAAVLCVVMAVGMTAAFTACGIGGEKDILVISREDSSGTRDAFDSLVAKDGIKLKDSEMTQSVEILSKTGDVITKVSAVESAIGYISLGSMSDTVKALSVGGVAATADNVKTDTYKLWRPFVIMTNKAKTEAGELTAAAKDFLGYLKSTTAQTIVSADYVTVTAAEAYAAPAEAVSGSVVIRGSTSVEPLMGKLIADYQAKGGSKVTGVTFDMQCQGSSYGISAAKEDTANGNVIGLSSSAIKSADSASLSHFDVAQDAIAVIVNKANTVSDIAVSRLYDIYTGTVTKFSELSADAAA